MKESTTSSSAFHDESSPSQVTIGDQVQTYIARNEPSLCELRKTLRTTLSLSEHDPSTVSTLDAYGQRLLFGSASHYDSEMQPSLLEPFEVLVALVRTIPVASTSLALVQVNKVTTKKTRKKNRDTLSKANNTCVQSLQAKLSSLDALLRLLQWQAVIRLECWLSFGRDFEQTYAKNYATEEKRRKKRGLQSTEKQSSDSLLWRDLTAILSMVALRLSQVKSFATFLLDECFDSKSYHTPIVQRLLDYFEVVLPSGHTDKGSVGPYEPTRSKLNKKKVVREMPIRSSFVPPGTQAPSLTVPPQSKAAAMAAKQSPRSASPIGSKNSDTSLKDAFGLPLNKAGVSLTARVGRSTNSLLANDTLSRSRFVGSHFNSNLSNMSSLFRQVKVATKRPVKKPSSRRPFQSVSRQSLDNKMPTSLLSPSRSTKTSQPLSLRPRNLPHLPNSRMVHETPQKVMPKSWSERRKRSNIVLETPCALRAPEDPSKKKKQRAFVVHGRVSQELEFGEDKSQSNATLVAEAIRAVRRR